MHIIAQKADGALRDALSIFDQLVSFAGNELSYENVILNLNVLDYDYYFKVISLILHGNASGTLLIINEIISNGFDGQHFIIGLGEHLRNLLICKDPSTANLLEISENLKKKYIDQAGQCETDFLLRALSINNQFDIQYKESNNKRLHLELALLQMCGLMGYPAEQKKVEKKSLNLPPPDTKPKPPPAEAKADPKPVETKTVIEKPVEKKPVEVKAAEENLAEVIPPPPPEEKKDAIEHDTAFLGRTSIKSVSRELNGDKNKKDQAGIEQPKQDSPFTQEELERIWAKGIPIFCKHSVNLQSSFKGRKPILEDDFSIVITAENKVIEGELKALLPEILLYFKTELKNDFIQINTRLADIKEQEDKAYFPDEIYKKMVEKNPEMKTLRDQLDLEIDF